MATVASPYGLKPVNLIGGQYNNGGVIREYLLSTNNAAAIYTGDLVQLAAGVPSVVTATPVAGTTAGIVGVCVGVRYQLANSPTGLGYPLFAPFLPANAVNSGFTNIFIRVCDDPDQLYQVQASGSVTRASIGRNAPLGNFAGGTGGSTGNTVTGNSVVNLAQGSIATTATLAVRIVDLVNSTSTFGGNFPSNVGDAFTDCIVKLNQGVHSYYFATGA